jgi:2-dehydro-3-deoxy-D-arabinonate dehydratase
MLLYKTQSGWQLETEGIRLQLPAAGIAHQEDLHAYLQQAATNAPPVASSSQLLPPIDLQEVWAAGVTYFRSRTARMAESETAGGGSFYDRVYNAERPELFFKAPPYRVVGPGSAVRIRRDSKWNVPEPELALLISPGGKITGYTIGNDMSSRDIEGENPLYLPQAKSYDGSCALGPAILVTPEPLASTTEIRMNILRAGAAVFADSTTLAAMKRRPAELVEYLFRETSFPNGCFLLTGTGIIPPDTFTLHSGDVVEIAIDGIGVLRNTVASE